MKVNLRLVLMAAAVMVLTSGSGVTLNLDRVQQRYPWNGFVDIDYTIADVSGDVNDYIVKVTVTADSQEWVAQHFKGLAWCDLPTTAGKHRVTWDSAADGANFISKNVSVKIDLLYAPVTAADADYAIVDLSAGVEGTSYPVRYVCGPEMPSSQFNQPVYRTTKLVLKRVKAGEFWMGDNNVSSGTARFRARLTEDYFLGVFPVTQKQYLSVVGGKNPSKYTNDMDGDPVDERPIETVSYDTISGSQGFLAKINAKALCRGSVVDGFALPTEAEWEYACRAGCEKKYFWDSDDSADIGDYAWWQGNASSITHACGSKLPNAWGFYDIIGNVWEWTRAWRINYPAYSADSVWEDPQESTGTSITVRGGSCNNYTDVALWRSGYRSQALNPTGNWVGYGVGGPLGFRLSLSAK